jgi:hypothetical protein
MEQQRLQANLEELIDFSGPGCGIQIGNLIAAGYRSGQKAEFDQFHLNLS